jgi:hypothetical protein
MPDEQSQIDELYAEGATDNPPPELDEKIRAAARQPVKHPWYKNPGRLAALATAASLVIAVSVIFFEPEQLAVEEPTQAIDAESTQLLGHEESRFDAEAVPENQAAEAPAAAPAPAKHVARPSADRVSGRQDADSADTVLRAMESDPREAAIEEAMVSGSRIGSAAIVSSPAEVLAERCGPLPGSEETREISEDESGWLVTVRIGTDVRTWRCIDGAWIETTSAQQ